MGGVNREGGSMAGSGEVLGSAWQAVVKYGWCEQGGREGAWQAVVKYGSGVNREGGREHGRQW